MLSVHRKQTYNRNYHCPRLSHSLSSPSAITNKTHSVEVVRNYSPLHPHSPTPFLLARHRIHYHVHIIINALHSLRDNATLKNEVTTLVIIPFYGIMATIHSSSTSGDYRKLHSTLITCSRYCHSNWTSSLHSFQYSSNSNDQNPTHFYSETMQSSSSNEYSIIQAVREQLRLRRDNDS